MLKPNKSGDICPIGGVKLNNSTTTEELGSRKQSFMVDGGGNLNQATVDPIKGIGSGVVGAEGHMEYDEDSEEFHNIDFSVNGLGNRKVQGYVDFS